MFIGYPTYLRSQKFSFPYTECKGKGFKCQLAAAQIITSKQALPPLSENAQWGCYLSPVKWPSATDFTGQVFVIRYSSTFNHPLSISTRDEMSFRVSDLRNE